jgi:hypothetical protein
MHGIWTAAKRVSCQSQPEGHAENGIQRPDANEHSARIAQRKSVRYILEAHEIQWVNDLVVGGKTLGPGSEFF